MKLASLAGGFVLCAALMPAAGAAQQSYRLSVDPKTSLAWWQIDPNYGHLWATTCPDDLSWQPGEARSAGGNINVKSRKQTVASASSSRDRVVPIYPRGEVSPVCRAAVRGSVIALDTLNWRGTRGEIRILPDSLVTGNDMRDKFARKSVFETAKFREIKFQIDSLTNVQTGDTIRAIAMGTLELHGERVAATAPVKAWRDKHGMRVQTQMEFPAHDLTRVYHFSKLSLGMGVTLGRWKTVYMGIDAILVPAPTD
ncbi:MAG TPA: YceI family protein [Longimicrobiales bacterium]